MRTVALFALALLSVVGVHAGPARAFSSVGNALPLAVDTPPPTPARLLTNAERFARGLPPAPPRRRATPVRRQGGASPTPTVTYQGSIQVRGTDDSVLGYFSKESVSGAIYQLAPDASDALAFSFALPVGQTSGNQLDLTDLNSDIPGYSLIGLISPDAADPDMNTGSLNFGYFGNVGPTAPGALPAIDGNSYSSVVGDTAGGESAVWSIDLATNAITPRWVNSDGSIPALALWLSGDVVYFGGTDAMEAQDINAIPIAINIVIGTV